MQPTIRLALASHPACHLRSGLRIVCLALRQALLTVNSALKPKTDSSPCYQIRHWQARAHIDDGCDHLKAALTLYASLVYSLHSVASASNAMPRQCDGLCGVGVARPVRSERNVHDPVLLPKVRLRCGLPLVALLGWACILCEPKPSVDSADRSLALAAAWR